MDLINIIETVLKLLTIEGLIFGLYFIFLLVLSPFAATKIQRIKDALKRERKINIPDKTNNMTLNNYINWDSFFKDLGLGVVPMDWLALKKRVFREVDLDGMQNQDVHNEISSLKLIQCFNKVGYWIWILSALGWLAFAAWYLKSGLL